MNQDKVLRIIGGVIALASLTHIGLTVGTYWHDSAILSDAELRTATRVFASAAGTERRVIRSFKHELRQMRRTCAKVGG